MPGSVRTRKVAISFLLLCCSFRQAGAQTASPAERRIALAKQVLANNPKSLQSSDDLASALCERARETGQVQFFDLANTALQEAFKIAPADYRGQKIHVAVLLGLGRIAEALEAAKQLNHQVPDDIEVWGLLSETSFAVGDYREASKAAQWMLDLRPGNSEALVPVARIREAYGDLDGASDFLDQALRRTPENEWAYSAYLSSQLARLQWIGGNPKRAAEFLAQALKLFPEYHEALRVSAALQKAAGNYREAVSLLERRYRQVSSTSALYELAEALERAGRKEEAAAAFHEFEAKALAETALPNNANRELVSFYLDHRARPAEALAIAQRERTIKHDVATLDLYAWALFRNGKIEKAKVQIDEAIAVGTRDPTVLLHAARITKSRSLPASAAHVRP